MRILVLGGAGLMGAGTIRDLLSEFSSGVEQVVAADSSAERLARLAHELRDPRLGTREIDVSDGQALAAALSDCDLCINGVPTFAGYQMAIFEACLAARRTYVDYGGMGVFTVKQKAMHDRFVEAGVTAVIGLGADPGLSNVICRACADRLDRIEKINLYWAAVGLGPESPVLVPPYSISTLLAEYSNPSQQFLEGALREVPPRSGLEELELGPPWGRTTFIYSQHSEPLTVPFARGIAEKGIREFTWRLSLPPREHEAWLGLARAGFGQFDEPVTVRGGTVRPLDVLQAVIDRNMARHRDGIPPFESHDIHFATGVGTRDGRATRVTVRVVSRPDPLYEGYVDAATSMNMSIGVQQILRRGVPPGVWAPEECMDVDDYLHEVRRRRFQVSIETVTVES
ncbi:MAG: saccharopine dehydrogenase NADP-binding domain-containing protein [Armatimonadetes bacterium]|nr:saccharopine dehydrogenase NADP-binding domain-containing protein [Armatimonadota bacterium]